MRRYSLSDCYAYTVDRHVNSEFDVNADPNCASGGAAEHHALTVTDLIAVTVTNTDAASRLG